jgi:hypothetical protein
MSSGGYQTSDNMREVSVGLISMTGERFSGGRKIWGVASGVGRAGRGGSEAGGSDAGERCVCCVIQAIKGVGGVKRSCFLLLVCRKDLDTHLN